MTIKAIVAAGALAMAKQSVAKLQGEGITKEVIHANPD